MTQEVLSIFCAKCAKSKPKNKSIREYSKVEVARTPYGILIWCMHCDEEIAHFPYDFTDIDKKNPNICDCEGCKKKGKTNG